MSVKRDWLMKDEDDHLLDAGRNGQTKEEDGTAESEFDGIKAMGIIGQGKPLVRFHVIREPGTRYSYQYVGLDSHSEYQPGRFIIRVSGATKLWQITVTGRNLWQVYDALTRHAAPWIQQLSPENARRDGFEPIKAGQKAEAVITEIQIEEVKEEA